MRDVILLLGVFMPFIAATQPSRSFFALFILWFVLGSIVGYGERLDMPPLGNGPEVIASLFTCLSLAVWFARAMDSRLSERRNKGEKTWKIGTR